MLFPEKKSKLAYIVNKTRGLTARIFRHGNILHFFRKLEFTSRTPNFTSIEYGGKVSGKCINCCMKDFTSVTADNSFNGVSLFSHLFVFQFT